MVTYYLFSKGDGYRYIHDDVLSPYGCQVRERPLDSQEVWGFLNNIPALVLFPTNILAWTVCDKLSCLHPWQTWRQLYVGEG